ncbi:MAG: 50S ribosomal protein L10 [Candidatus Ancillula sp.]|jgi:large subunit ribosomal protein L10|nr:50S ribosomal protein L10 [Candidatus Ancillula sp.]
MATEKKIQQVGELKELFENSSAVLLTEYRGLTVAQIKDLRVKLGENVTYHVAKNTLVKIAAKSAGVDYIDESQLAGPTALAFVNGDDPVTPAKVLRDFAKEADALVIKGGIFDGAALDAEGVIKLASLESREVLLAKVAGAVKAGIAKAAYVLQAPASKTVRTIDALKAKKEA